MAAIKYTWTPEVRIIQEEELLKVLVSEKGEKKWCTIASIINQQFAGSEKSGKQCRERWHNHLNPELNKDSFTLEDEIKVFEYQRQYGNKWSLIAEHFEGRNDNFIKNCFYSAIRRNLRKFNKKKVPSKQLKGTVSALMKNPQTRKILMNFPEHEISLKKEEEKIVREKFVRNRKKDEQRPSLTIDVGKNANTRNIGDITPTLFAAFSLGIRPEDYGEHDGVSVSTPIDYYRFEMGKTESYVTTPLLELCMQNTGQHFAT